MKVNEIREMNAEELNQKLASLKEELFNLRFQLATGQLENPMRIKESDMSYPYFACRCVSTPFSKLSCLFAINSNRIFSMAFSLKYCSTSSAVRSVLQKSSSTTAN